jgi:hypothetical protein
MWPSPDVEPVSCAALGERAARGKTLNPRGLSVLPSPYIDHHALRKTTAPRDPNYDRHAYGRDVRLLNSVLIGQGTNLRPSTTVRLLVAQLAPDQVTVLSAVLLSVFTACDASPVTTAGRCLPWSCTNTFPEPGMV